MEKIGANSKAKNKENFCNKGQLGERPSKHLSKSGIYFEYKQREF